MVVPQLPRMGHLFYDRLFDVRPDVSEIFPKGDDMALQEIKLMRMLDFVISNLDNIGDIVPDVQVTLKA